MRFLNHRVVDWLVDSGAVREQVAGWILRREQNVIAEIAASKIIPVGEAVVYPKDIFIDALLHWICEEHLAIAGSTWQIIHREFQRRRVKTVSRDDVSRKFAPSRRIDDLLGFPEWIIRVHSQQRRKISAQFGIGRYKRIPGACVAVALSLISKEEECAIMPVVQMRDGYGTAHCAAELVAFNLVALCPEIGARIEDWVADKLE